MMSQNLPKRTFSTFNTLLLPMVFTLRSESSCITTLKKLSTAHV